MTKLAIVGTVAVRPGTREDALRAILAHRDRCLKEEPGTLQFEVLVPLEDDSKLLLYEVYADRTAFKAHWNGTSMAQVRAELGSNVTSLTGVQCTLGQDALGMSATESL